MSERPSLGQFEQLGIWAGVTLSLIVHRWAGGGARALPDPLSGSRALSRYIVELERQRADAGLAWWWYFAPLFAGILFNTVAFGVAGRQPLAIAVGLGACSVLIVRAGARRRARLGAKIRPAQTQRRATARLSASPERNGRRERCGDC
jgi:hypothetical protein